MRTSRRWPLPVVKALNAFLTVPSVIPCSRSMVGASSWSRSSRPFCAGSKVNVGVEIQIRWSLRQRRRPAPRESANEMLQTQNVDSNSIKPKSTLNIQHRRVLIDGQYGHLDPASQLLLHMLSSSRCRIVVVPFRSAAALRQALGCRHVRVLGCAWRWLC